MEKTRGSTKTALTESIEADRVSVEPETTARRLGVPNWRRLDGPSRFRATRTRNFNFER